MTPEQEEAERLDRQLRAANFVQLVADSWEQMRACDIERLLCESPTASGRRKIADMIEGHRPDLKHQVKAELELLTHGLAVLAMTEAL